MILYDPRNGDLSLRIEPFDMPAGDTELPRSNYFSIYWAQQGAGHFTADFGRYGFSAPSFLFLVPYQLARFATADSSSGLLLQFHANFLCIETHHEEVGCNGVLFNDLYGSPVVALDADAVAAFGPLFDSMSRELRAGALAHSEALLAYLKILLIQATRLKLRQHDLSPRSAGAIPPILLSLRDLIETQFRSCHTPAGYAELLAISPKALSRLVKAHHGKTLTDLIRERIVKQAKWELLHTRKPVKNVAAELGYEDVFYFSRLFKRATGVSPTFFRDFETEIRGGRNLSMS